MGEKLAQIILGCPCSHRECRAEMSFKQRLENPHLQKYPEAFAAASA